MKFCTLSAAIFALLISDSARIEHASGLRRANPKKEQTTESKAPSTAFSISLQEEIQQIQRESAKTIEAMARLTEKIMSSAQEMKKRAERDIQTGKRMRAAIVQQGRDRKKEEIESKSKETKNATTKKRRIIEESSEEEVSDKADSKSQKQEENADSTKSQKQRKRKKNAGSTDDSIDETDFFSSGPAGSVVCVDATRVSAGPAKKSKKSSKKSRKKSENFLNPENKFATFVQSNPKYFLNSIYKSHLSRIEQGNLRSTCKAFCLGPEKGRLPQIERVNLGKSVTFHYNCDPLDPISRLDVLAERFDVVKLMQISNKPSGANQLTCIPRTIGNPHGDAVVKTTLTGHGEELASDSSIGQELAPDLGLAHKETKFPKKLKYADSYLLSNSTKKGIRIPKVIPLRPKYEPWRKFKLLVAYKKQAAKLIGAGHKFNLS